jgi:hypothetical protein
MTLEQAAAMLGLLDDLRVILSFLCGSVVAFAFCFALSPLFR